jgi:hypothetical protein
LPSKPPVPVITFSGRGISSLLSLLIGAERILAETGKPAFVIDLASPYRARQGVRIGAWLVVAAAEPSADNLANGWVARSMKAAKVFGLNCHRLSLLPN